MSIQLSEALDKLKNNGVRMTPQRHAILSYLLHSLNHPTADEIYKALESKFPNMSVATVYNNLKVFMESGLVRELTYGDSSSRFDADMSEHYHATCVGCGKIVDFEIPAFMDAEIAASEQTNFHVQGHRFEVYGTCPDCSKTRMH